MTADRFFGCFATLFFLLIAFLATECHAEKREGIVYTREQLIALCKPALLPAGRPEIPEELRRRRRGCRAGAKRRAKLRRYKPAVPALIVGNVRSLPNKMDELVALVRTQREYRECSMMSFTETWLHSNVPDQSVEIPGFSCVRADRDARSGKKKGGGIALFVSERWCHPGHVHVKERLCSPDIELLAVGIRPYYLPREFTSAIVVTVYIPPSADGEAACDVINSVVARLQTQHPSAFVVITGDFNHNSLEKSLPTFHQYVDCPTRNSSTLDLLYANAPNAYSATALPPLGRADHNLVLLTPQYVPIVQRQPVPTRSVRRWTQEADEALQDCFESTDWGVLCEPYGEDINGLTECITDYIKFCEDTTLPARTVRCFPNNKPWITSDLKMLLNKKKQAFRSGNRDQLKDIQRELRVKLRQGKDAYRRKLEAKLQQNRVKDVWTGMKEITGFRKRDGLTAGSLERVNELNGFFNRFSSQAPAVSSTPIIHTSTHPVSYPSSLLTTGHYNTPPPLASPMDSTPMPSSGPPTTTSTPHRLTCGQVKSQLERLHQGKAAGPDGIRPRLLRTCASQLCVILVHLFNMSLSLEKVPLLWKTACVVPVPKKKSPSALNDYRPVALTSHVMKVMERLVLAHLRPQVKTSLDPLQFAYQPHLGVDDAITYLLQRAHSYLDGGDCTVRITFFDFSSAFNTIRPLLLSEKLRVMGVDTPTISWIADYLTGRPQFVRLGSVLSETVVSNTGAPQGTVLSPFLFTLYTSDFQYNTGSCHLQKFSDDSAVVGCVQGGREEEDRTVVSDFVDWAGENHLLLNVAKTREMVIDFRRNKSIIKPLGILGENVTVVDDHKFLGVHLDSRLNWKTQADSAYRKGMSRLYFLRKLRSFHVCSKMLEIFYQSVVAGALFSAVVSWGSSIGAGDRNRLEKLIRKAGSVIGGSVMTFEEVVERRTLDKLLSIMDNPDHPLHHIIDRHRSSFSSRLLQLRCHKERYRRSFLPTAIKLYNKSL